MKKNWIVILFLLNLTGCATYGDSIPKTTSMDQVDQLAGSHQPVEYKLGFKEGCDSGLVSAGNSSYKVQKDSHRYSVDDLYKHGWDDGFNKCKQYKVQSPSADTANPRGLSARARTVWSKVDRSNRIKE